MHSVTDITRSIPLRPTPAWPSAVTARVATAHKGHGGLHATLGSSSLSAISLYYSPRCASRLRVGCRRRPGPSTGHSSSAPGTTCAEIRPRYARDTPEIRRRDVRERYLRDRAEIAPILVWVELVHVDALIAVTCDDRALAGARSGDDEIRRRGYEGCPHRLRHLGDLSRRMSDDEKLRGEARRACGAYDLGEYLGGFTSSASEYVTADSIYDLGEYLGEFTSSA